MEKRLINKIFLVLFSFLLGVIIYLLFRSRKLFYYKFIEIAHLNYIVEDIRKIVWVYRKYIPNWVIYSLPDGLWIFSLGVAMLHNRVFYKTAQVTYNIIFIFILGVEFFQNRYGGHGTFIGTYDFVDLVCFTVGFLLASLIGYINWKNDYKDKKILDKSRIYKKEIKKNLIIVIIFTILGLLPALAN
ncbi:hypothetical protein [Cetobacterium sp.]|uniref:hypothetical protein n=2 Tax=Cetobacterium sp. TaxID=2071632 RepID=UPI002FCB458F